MTPAPLRSVAVFVHRLDPLEFLLLKRTPERGGFWQPVTGRVEPGDAAPDPCPPVETCAEAGECPDLHLLLGALAREVSEETGVVGVEAAVDLGLETTFTGYDGNLYRERALAARVPRHAEATLSAEHTELAWLPVEAALERLEWAENRTALLRLVAHLTRS